MGTHAAYSGSEARSLRWSTIVQLLALAIAIGSVASSAVFRNRVFDAVAPLLAIAGVVLWATVGWISRLSRLYSRAPVAPPQRARGDGAAPPVRAIPARKKRALEERMNIHHR